MGARTWPCLGRGEQQARIRSLLGAAMAGQGGVIVVTGEAGIGKTHLVESCLTADEGHGRLLRSRGRGPASPPFGAAFEALGVSRGDLFDPSLRRGSLIEVAAGDIGQVVIAEQLDEHLEALRAAGPVSVVIDDYHELDRASARWLGGVAERAAALGAAVVITSRPPRPGTPAAEGWERLVQAAESIELEPLVPEDVLRLGELRLGAPVGPELRVALAATGNVPLLVTGLLETIDDDEVIDVDGARDLAPAAGARLRGDAPRTTVARLRDLDDEVRSVLQAVAVLQPGGTVSHVERVLERPLARVVEALDHLDRLGLVTVRNGQLEVGHDLYRAAALATLTEVGRVALHARAVEVGRDLGDPVQRVAGHVVEAGLGGEAAVEVLISAAGELAPLDAAAALGLANHAVGLVPTPPRALTRVRARALGYAGRDDEAELLVRSLLDDATAEERPELHRDLALALFQQGRANEASEAMRTALSETDDRAAAARLESELSFAVLLTGDFAGADEVARRGAEAGRAVGDVTAVVAAEMVGCLTAHYRNEVDRAGVLAADLVRLAELPEAGDAVVYQPWFAASLFHLESDEHDRALAVNAAGRARVRAVGQQWMLPAYDALDAYVALRRGQLDDAEAAARAALAYGLEDRLGVAVWCHGFLAQIAVHRGDEAAAVASLAAGDGLLAAGRAQLGWEHLALPQARLAMRQGRYREATDALVSVWDLFETLGVRSAMQELVLELSVLAAATGDRDRLDRVRAVAEAEAERTGTPGWRAAAAAAEGLAAEDPSRLAEAAEAYLEVGRPLRAGLALGWAADLERRTAGPDAEGWRERAIDLLAGCGAEGDAAALRIGSGSSTGSSAAPGDGGAGGDGGPPERPTALAELSRREWTVVQLVVEGLSNSEIAERLHVSRRTVESHVSAAYRKLGVANRVELARLGLGAAEDDPR